MGWPSWPMLLWRRSHRRRASSCSRTPTASNVLDTRSPRCWPTASRRHAGGEHPPSGSRTSGRSGRSSTGGSRRASARRRSSLSTSAGDRSRPWTVPPSSYMRADPTCRQAWPWTTAHRAPGRFGSRTATDRAWSTAIPPTVPIARRSTAPWGPVNSTARIRSSSTAAPPTRSCTLRIAGTAASRSSTSTVPSSGVTVPRSFGRRAPLRRSATSCWSGIYTRA